MQTYDNIKTIQDAIRYWRQCADDSPATMPIPNKAARLVGIIHADNWEEWNEHPLFADLFEIAASLEMDAVDDQHNEKRWQEILNLLAQLEAKYL